MNFRKDLFKTYHLISRKNTLNHLKTIERTQFLSKEELDKIRFKKLKNLLNYTYKNVPFYRKTFKELKLTPDDIKSSKDLDKLPVISKDDIINNFKQMVSVEYSSNDLIKNSTGGSTGKNLNFYKDKKHSEIRHAFALRGDKWAGLDIGTKNAYLWGSTFDLSLTNTIGGQISNKVLGSIFLSSYELSDEKMLEYAQILKKYSPKVLIAYPSSLYIFAKFLEKYEIDYINFNSIITSAETLYDYQRESIEEIFSCKVFNRYGCREFGPIAHECSNHSGLHINSEHLYLELLGNKDYKDTYGNESSRIIVTDLDNYAMPFIRYEIGDIGKILDYNCDCGRGLPLMNVEGRTFDVVVGVNGNRLGGTFWTLLLRTYVEGIEQFQVIQKSKDTLNIKIVVNDEFNEEYINHIRSKILEYCGDEMRIKFNLVDCIDKTPAGKYRFVINQVNQ